MCNKAGHTNAVVCATVVTEITPNKHTVTLQHVPMNKSDKRRNQTKKGGGGEAAKNKTLRYWPM